MNDDSAIVIDAALSIPRDELTFRATRSGGPGGQHVNTSSTRVELTWNVAASPSLSDAQRARLLEKLVNRIDRDGVLRIVTGRSRSQARNREDVTERFRILLAAALREPTPRRRTRIPRAVKEERLRRKRLRAETKRRRGRPDDAE